MELNSKYLFITLFATSLLSTSVGAYFGTKLAPNKIIEREAIKEQEKVVQKEAEKSVEEIKIDSKQEKVVKKIKVQIEKPDGTKIQIEKEDSTENKQEAKEVVKYVEKEVVVEREKIVEKKSERIVDNRASWMFGAKIGLDSLTPTAQNYIVGVEADRRILGPFWLGVWATTNPTFSKPAAGLSLKMEY